MIFAPTGDKDCVGCGKPMPGIRSYNVRTHCERCGGNTTEYDKRKPNPMKGRRNDE